MRYKENIKKALKELHGAERAEYILSYFKLPIILALVLIIIIISIVYRWATARNTVLYAAVINISVEDKALTDALTIDYIAASDLDPGKYEIALTPNLYLSKDTDDDNASYAYASTVKLMAMTEAKQLDVVIMSESAADIMTTAGYLYEFPNGQILFPIDLKDFGYTDTVYAGVIANTPRIDEAKKYIDYL